MIKTNYKNAQNKLLENYTKWFIELIKKWYLKKISFLEISKDFIKKNWINNFNLFSINDLIQFHLHPIFKKVIYNYFIKRIYYKISIWQQKLFLQVYLKRNFFYLLFKKKKKIFTILFTKEFYSNYVYLQKISWSFK